MNDILQDVNELKELVISSSEYTNYIESLKKVEENKEINKLINKIVLLQKKIVKKEVSKENTLNEEMKLDDLYKELYSYDDYNNYINDSKVLNVLITSIQKKFEEYFNSLMNKK